MPDELDLLIDEMISDAPVLLAISESGYGQIRIEYSMQVAGIITEFLFAERLNTVRSTGQFKLLITDYFQTAFELGYMDGGGKLADITEDDRAWLVARINAEMGYVELLFQSLKDSRDNLTPGELPDVVDQKAETYTKTLDGVYNEGKIRAGKDAPLTFVGDDGSESCPTCQKWKDKRHRKSFWLKRGLIPGQPGNPNFECRGYNCQHYLIDDDGNAYTF